MCIYVRANNSKSIGKLFYIMNLCLQILQFPLLLLVLHSLTSLRCLQSGKTKCIKNFSTNFLSFSSVYTNYVYGGKWKNETALENCFSSCSFTLHSFFEFLFGCCCCTNATILPYILLHEMFPIAFWLVNRICVWINYVNRLKCECVHLSTYDTKLKIN